jgi:RNA polymerase sigma-70 factor (ECF subfamily)
MATVTELETDLSTLRSGDIDAMGQWLESFREYLLLVANQELEPGMRTKLGASDLVQETFLGAHRDLAYFRGRTVAEWRLWLRGILIHLVANHRRRFRSTLKRQVERELPLAAAALRDHPSSNGTPSTELTARETESAVMAAMDSLTEYHRDVVLWHHRDGLPFREIGQRLGITADAARKHWERALKALRKELRTHHAPL